MRKKYFLFIALPVITGLISCRKYVEIDQHSTRTLKTASDYELLLNNTSLFSYNVNFLPFISSDDVDANGNTNIELLLTNELADVYTWQSEIYNSSQSDPSWDKLYNIIYNCNVITDGVLNSEQGSEADKQKLYAEARAQRAWAYLTLVNIYAPVYNQSSAAADLGVPLTLNSGVVKEYPRATLQETYDQIITDAKESIDALPNTPINPLRAGKAAAYGILARTYLMMSNYDSAAKYASLTLSIQSSLLDLNNYKSAPTTLPLELKDPEVILHKTFYPSFYMPLNPDAVALYDSASDLRFQIFLQSGLSGFPAFNGKKLVRYNYTGETYAIECGITVPEVMLIEAEALARNNSLSESLTILNTLRKNRLSADSYKDYQTDNKDSLIVEIINEKRREFVQRGLRWFDQRRLSQDPLFAKTYSRTLNGETYQLAPGSTHYVYPVPPIDISLSDGELIQNEY